MNKWKQTLSYAPLRMARNTRRTSSADKNAGSGRVKSNSGCHVVGSTLGRGWAATCAFQKLERLSTSTERTFCELHDGIKGNHARCLWSTFSSSALLAGAWCFNTTASVVFTQLFKTSKWGCPSSLMRFSQGRWWNFDDIVEAKRINKGWPFSSS